MSRNTMYSEELVFVRSVYPMNKYILTYGRDLDERGKKEKFYSIKFWDINKFPKNKMHKSQKNDMVKQY